MGRWGEVRREGGSRQREESGEGQPEEMGSLREQEHAERQGQQRWGGWVDLQEPQLERGRGQLVMRPSAGRLRMGHGEPGQSQNRLCQDEGSMASQREAAP